MMEDLEEFRFKTRQEYEKELKRLLTNRQFMSSETHRRRCDEEYESLVEEYLRFREKEDA